MYSILLIAVGKMKEKSYIQAAGEYEKRLGAFCALKIIELAEQRLSAKPTQGEIDVALEKEAQAIQEKIPAGAWICALDIEGKAQDSEVFANTLQTVMESGRRPACFLIGGSVGLHEALKRRCDLRLTMSSMTFPHHLARVMFLEQLYRGFSILHNSRYHK